MKILELVNMMNQNKSKLTKVEQVQAILKKELEVKEYLNIKDKKALVQDIVNECILYSDCVYKFDEIEKYICFTMRTIAAYTNLELSDDIEEDYDLLCEAKLLNSIIELFHGEYDNVKVLLQMKCDYILSDNTMEAQFGRFLENIIEKIDDAVRVLENFDITNLPISASDIEKLMNFVNIK